MRVGGTCRILFCLLQFSEMALSYLVFLLLLTVPRRCFFRGSFLLFMFRVCHAFCLFFFCGLVVTCWEKADLLALLCVMFSCVFVASACGVLGQAWDLIVSIPDLCLLTYLVDRMKFASLETIFGMFVCVCVRACVRVCVCARV